jgi:hypothetical protein
VLDLDLGEVQHGNGADEDSVLVLVIALLNLLVVNVVKGNHLGSERVDGSQCRKRQLRELMVVNGHSG